MPKLTIESAKEAIRQMATDQFSFEDLRELFPVDYESLREVLFELLGEPAPTITQTFDPDAKAIRFNWGWRMKLLRLQVISAETCGRLLDGFEAQFRSPATNYSQFDPLCLVGPNGTGKSQLMQVIAEMLQSAIHACNPIEERRETNPSLQFEIEYLIRPNQGAAPVQVRLP